MRVFNDCHMGIDVISVSVEAICYMELAGRRIQPKPHFVVAVKRHYANATAQEQNATANITDA